MTPPVSPGTGRWPALILLLATSVGVPGTVLTIFKAEATRHPWLALLCIAAWEVLVLIGGIVTDVWSKLRSRWIDRLTNWVDNNLQTLFSRYKHRYLRWNFYQHRDFDVKGLSTQGTYNLDLEQVFVDLSLEPTPAHSTSQDPLRQPLDRQGERHPIWHYLNPNIDGNYLVLIGAPGSGKTTLLKKVALHISAKSKFMSRRRVPILLFLREHTNAILSDPYLPLADAISSALARKGGPKPPPKWFESRLNNGRTLILLDGLDEVAVPEVRKKVVAWVELNIKTYPQNSFIISSRPHGYRSNPIDGVTVLEVQPFNNSQVVKFVQNWYLANEIRASGRIDPGVRMAARAGAGDLLRRLLHSPTLTDLSVNPLLLTMISTVHRFRSSLPGRRVELYAEICEVFLGKRHQARGLETDLTPLQKQRVLEPLAYHLMITKSREAPVEEIIHTISPYLHRVAGSKSEGAERAFLSEIEGGSGLLLEREAGVYGFAHLGFQEYLASVHAREERLENEIVSKVTDPWWHEVIRLYGAQGDASSILAACLTSDQPTVMSLSLAIDCLEEALEVDPPLRKRVEVFLVEGVEKDDSAQFSLAAETLLERRLRDMPPVSEGIFADGSYITNAEFQVFLDEQRAFGNFFQPDHWQSLRFPKGQSLSPVVGARLNDALFFCNWLSKKQGSWQFRLPSHSELTGYDLPAVLCQPDSAAGHWVTSEDHRFEKVIPSMLPVPSWYASRLLTDDISFNENFDRARALGLRLATVFARVGTNEEILRQIAHLDKALDQAREYVRELTKITALDTSNFFKTTSCLDLDQGLKIVTEPSILHILDCALDRSLLFGKRLGLNMIDDSDFNTVNLYRILRWIARIFSLSRVFLTEKPRLQQKGTRFKHRAAEQQEPTAREQYILLYCSLVTLESRINGVIPACEGIRIVKERRS